MDKRRRIKMQGVDYRYRLFWWNIGVTCVHWTSFIALMVISFTRLDRTQRVHLWFDAGYGQAIPRSLGSYPLFATLVPFPFLTGCFHVMAALNVDQYYHGTLKLGMNRLRWVEYAITNGLMTWSLCVLVGAGSILVPILCVFSNFVMQSFGWFHERRNHGVTRAARSLTPLLLGFIPWIVTWATILSYWSVNGGNVAKALAVWGTFVWSLGFVAPLLWRYKQPNMIKHNYNMEMAYMILSLSAKLWLDWTLVIGNLVE